MSKIENNLDLTFLKQSPWSETGYKTEQLSEMFLVDFVEEKKARPDLGPKDLLDSAKNRFGGTLKALKQGGTIMGSGVPWGITSLNNYAEGWAFKQIAEYRATLKTNPDKAKEMRGKSVMIRTNSEGKEEIIALDTRETYKSGNRNDNFGSPLPPSTYLANFLATWKNSIDGKVYLVYSTVGGEISGDEVVNPACPVCGTDSYTKECKNIIVRNGVQSPCPGIKTKFIIENIMKSMGKVSDFALKLKEVEITDKETKKKSIKKIGPDLDTTTTFLGSKSLVLKYKKDAEGNFERDDKGFRTLEGDLLDWIPKDRILQGKNITKVWETLSQQSNKVVFYPCTIYKIEDRSSIFKTRTIWAQDDSLSAIDEGVSCSVPDHLLEHAIKGKIGVHSEVLFVGPLNRRKKKDPITKQLTNEWLPVTLDVAGVIGISIVAPIVKKAEIDKVDFGGNTYDAEPSSTEISAPSIEKPIAMPEPIGPIVPSTIMTEKPVEKPAKPAKPAKPTKDAKAWF